MKANKSLRILVALIVGLIVAACSTTRRLPEGELLYTGIKGIDYVYASDTTPRVPEALREEISTALFVKPNNYFSLLDWRYPFPLGLWVYNNWPNPEKGLKHWLFEKLAAEPVVVSDVRPEMRTHMIEQTLDNNGYFRGRVGYELVHPKNKRKAEIRYTITPGPAFPLDTIELLSDSTHIGRLVNGLARKDTYLHAGSRFCIDSLSTARNRITNGLRNKGYYFFRPDYIEYLADSIQTPGKVALRLDLASNIPAWAVTPYRTGKVEMIVRRWAGRKVFDTIPIRDDVSLIKMPKARVRRRVLTDNVLFNPGDTFSVRRMDFTQALLSRLGIFKAIDITATPDTVRPAERLLNVVVDCTLDQPWEASAEMNVSSKSNSYLGPGITIGLTNTNMFGGGEQFKVSLTGAYEWQTGKGSKGGIFNSYEGGITASLAFPRLLAPKFIPRNRFSLNWTRFTLNADILNRPHYFRMAQFNAGMTYDWRFRRHVSQSLTLFKLTYTKLMNTTEEFDAIMADNPAVALSFKSQYIPQMLYSYTYDRAFDSYNSLNWSFTLQEAGNLFWAIYQVCGKHGEKELFGTPFSQFVKGSCQLVYNRRLTGQQHLVGRVALGAAHAYGNASEVPYAEQFYCGGANSVRAFTVRSIGPGSYHEPDGPSNDYFDQTGTFKFEANLEYRFPIMGALHGAVFFDSGNVWLLKNDPQRPGGTLRARTFWRDLATGTGAGLRFDISMLVIRADLGVGIHAPYDTGKRGYYNMTSFGKSLAFHLAIGYPF